MREEDIKIIIKFPSLKREVETNLATMEQISKGLKNKKKRKDLFELIDNKKKEKKR